MKLLLVEDDDYKREHVRKFVCDAFPEIQLEFAKSYQSAVLKISSDAPDLIVLDMTLPTFDKLGLDAGRLRPLGGRELFDQVKRRGIRCRIVVLTGYDMLGEGKSAVSLKELAEDLRKRFPQLFVSAIFYSRMEDRWMQELHTLIANEQARVAPRA